MFSASSKTTIVSMAESDKGTASSSKAKEKISVLDVDISKNFLGSWNANIGAESDDSSMDFKFEPVKGKKKDFDFDKLDMDFSLDGEFDKIKSFKVDMGDLDFSSPPKKTSTKSKETDLDFSPPKASTKSKKIDLDFSSPPKEGTKFKERLEGESAKSNKGKKDCFAFSFDFNELDKFDLDTVLPTRTKEQNKDDGNKGVKINSTDKHEDQGSKVQLDDTDSRDAGALKAKAMPLKAKDSKENLVACGGDLDLLPEIDPYKPSTLQDQIKSKQSKTFLERENILKRSPVVKTTCNESYEESQLQNQSAQNVQDQTQSKPAPIVSEGTITDHAQRIDKQSDQVASFFNNSYEKPKVQNQPAWSFADKISAFNVSEQMQTTSAGDNLGVADSKMQDLNPKGDHSLISENEYFPVKKMTPQDNSKRLQNIPEVESEGTETTDGENNVPETCNVLHGDMDTAMVAENVLDVKGSPVADPSKLGAHAAESFSGRQKTPREIASSRVSRFNLKPITKDKAPASTQFLPRSNLVSLNRNAISSTHPSPSGARHSAHSARSRSKSDKNSGSFTQEAIGECFVSENNTKIVSDQSAREHCNAMVTQMKNNLGAISVPNDGKAADRGTTFLENEKKKEDSISSSFQVQSSKLPDWTTKSNNQGSEKLNPKTPSFQSVRKLKMDTIVGKLSTLKVSKKMPDLYGLKISSSPALEDKIVIAKNLDSNGLNVPTKTVQLVGSGKPKPPTPSYKAQSLAPSTKTVQLVGSGKPQPPTPSFKAQSLAPSIKRKIAEVSDVAPIMSHPSKRLSTSQKRNSKEDSEMVAQEKVGFHKNILDCSLKSTSDKQPESTFEMPHEMKFTDVGVTPVMENDETFEKAEACGKELDQICIMLRKKQEEAKEQLVRALVTNNKLLLLSNPMHALKLCQAQSLASRLMSKELPSRCVDPAIM